MKLSSEYFENKSEQAEIKEAVLRAIPENVYFHNLIIAFSEMLVRFTQRAFKDEVYNKSINPASKSLPPPQKAGGLRINGSRFIQAGENITIGCISPEAADLLDTVMEQWEAYLVEIKNHNTPNYEPTPHGFAYWLIRWSGLVQPSAAVELDR